MSKLITITTAVALSTALFVPTFAQAGLLTANPISADSPNAITQPVAKRSGKERLRRLLRPHSRYGNPIVQSVRDATGNPNIVVLDRRGGHDDVFQCSYFTLRGKRALICD